MDFLKKPLAPLTDEAWEMLNEEASDILKSVLSARKFVDVAGPFGLDFAAVHTGRINTENNKKKNVHYGINKVLPLVEVRTSFTMDIWELDNVSRGAESLNWDAMEEAACELATFEENAIYHGLNKAGVSGLKKCSQYDTAELPESTDALLNALSRQLTVFRKNGIEGPYSLVVNPDDWERLTGELDGYPLRKQIKLLLDGNIILSPFIKETFFVSERGGDFRLTLGQDISIGYQFHDEEKVKLYFTESFTFQCFEPAAVAVFT
jgi:uncharacterized linocin/CFP29 family protein